MTPAEDCVGIESLPENLKDAVAEIEKDQLIREALGEMYTTGISKRRRSSGTVTGSRSIPGKPMNTWQNSKLKLDVYAGNRAKQLDRINKI
jgi:hypothetical protein